MGFRDGTSFLWLALYILFSASYNSVSGQVTFLDLFRKEFRMIRTIGIEVIGRTSSSSRSLKTLTDLNRLQDRMPVSMPFPCDTRRTRSAKRPSSVHRLRPGDIDVIGALGDSLTAGNGIAAQNLLHVYTENRGLVWSIGGQETWREFLTLPNILKEFNPKLVGHALGDSLSTERASQFNVGEPGAMSRDMPYMVKQLVKRIRNDPRVDYKRDWKMVTMMIGPNDFCLELCYQRTPEILPELHRKDLQAVFTTIRDTMPRTIVNLVAAPNLRLITEFTNKSPTCRITNVAECPCLFNLAYEHLRPRYFNIMREWQRVEEEVANEPQFSDRDDFAVVFQPFSTRVEFPLTPQNHTDYTYLSMDCFHFSQKSNARAANALWNNILEPVGKKSTNWAPVFTQLHCPSEQAPYIYTRKNSGER